MSALMTVIVSHLVCGVSSFAADVPFVQEYHVAYPLAGEAANDVAAVAVDGAGNVWAATAAGAFMLPRGTSAWTACLPPEDAGPAFAAYADAQGTAWVGTWNGLYRAAKDVLIKVKDVDGPVSAIGSLDGGIAAAGPDGWWRVKGERVRKSALPCARSVRAVLDDGADGLWLATGAGLTHHGKDGDTLYQTPEEILAANVYDLVYAADGRLWAGGMGGITVYEKGTRVGQLTPKEGLPSIYVSALRRTSEGVTWIGTDRGVVRYDGTNWSLRHSRRWLLDDNVRDVAFDAEGTAWIATAKGVSAIKRKTMTLSEKADLYYDLCMARHVREPWIVEKCLLPVIGDTSKWEPVDDDNDGQYTSMYLAMESYRYAVTKDPDAREKARRAFETLRLFQTITETPGFIARTIVPSSWKRVNDGNRSYTPQQLADERVKDPRYKPVEVRWHPSSDGKWLWKGDTSSDEITGHFYGYLIYYDLAADEAQRDVVRQHVRNVMDYIIEHGYVLTDVDAKHTRWGVWAPERLNGDPDWAAESGVNAAEIVSYLTTAYHITGDKRYAREYRHLLQKHGYIDNIRRAKTFAPAWRTHIDDELLALAYPGLLLNEQDEGLRKVYRESLERWYSGIRADQSPYFNFVYGSLAGSDPELAQSIAYLRDVPLDMVNWTLDNSKREDLRFVRAPEIEPLQTERALPPSETAIMRWDKSPWPAIEGDGGRTEWCPVYWLLPYWMGRYYGFIAPAS